MRIGHSLRSARLPSNIRRTAPDGAQIKFNATLTGGNDTYGAVHVL